MKVRNTSEQAQHFPNIGTFEAGEAKEVSQETGEYLLRSPIMEQVTEAKKIQAKEKNKSMRGVESDE